MKKMKYYPNTEDELLLILQDKNISISDIDMSNIKGVSDIFKVSNKNISETRDISNIVNIADIFYGLCQR